MFMELLDEKGKVHFVNKNQIKEIRMSVKNKVKLEDVAEVILIDGKELRLPGSYTSTTLIEYMTKINERKMFQRELDRLNKNMSSLMIEIKNKIEIMQVK